MIAGPCKKPKESNMSSAYWQKWSKTYKEELEKNIMPFWMKHGFDRKNGGSFLVSDEAEFNEASEFENAVITLGTVKELGNDRYLITWKDKSLKFEVKSNVPYKFSIDTIRENTYHKLPVYRLAFTAEKSKNIKMDIIFTPVK